MFELGTDGPKSILVGIDGSDTSLRAGAYAAGLARRQGAELMVVYVHTPSAAVNPEAIVAERESQQAVVDELRATAEKQAGIVGVRIHFYERHGGAHGEIVALADELKVDAVVVGASTQAGHRLIGSLATKLVRDARWPVTVVP